MRFGVVSPKGLWLATLVLTAGCHSSSEETPRSDAGDAGHEVVHDSGREAARDATAHDAGTPDGGGKDTSQTGWCKLGGDGSYVNTPFQKLSEYCIAQIEDGGIVLAPGVVPYDLNTPLFSDYAVKVRGVWVPPGTHATYSDAGSMAFPVGTILTKSFGFADDMRKANPIINWIETRLVISTDSGYIAHTYLWDADHKDATLFDPGENVNVSWIDDAGATVNTTYLVPSKSQCEICHNLDGVVVPIGPKARQLNKKFEYPDGGENELAHWSQLGILEGAPDASVAPKLPVWDDPTTGTVAERARAYLEGNCAHCHNAEGYAFTTGLFLLANEQTPTTYGICKPPVAAGPATGGHSFDIVPGSAAESIMIYRVTSTEGGIMMPPLERSVEDVQGVALLTSWIDGLDGGCQ